MNRIQHSWRRMLAVAVITAAVAVLWCLTAGWISSLVQSFTRRDDVREEMQVALDGTPVISLEKQVGYSSTSVDRHTLDGKPWPTDYEYWLNAAYLDRPAQPPGLLYLPIRWNSYGSRIGSVQDSKRPPTAWYLVRDAEPAGHMYFAGFDAMSKLPVGFIGTAGFRLSSPAVDEQFAFPKSASGRFGESVATTQYIEMNRLRLDYFTSSEERLSPWLVYVDNQDQLCEVDLRQRTTRTVLPTPNVFSMSLLWVPIATIGVSPEAGALDVRARNPFHFTSSTDNIEVRLPATDFVPTPVSRRPPMTNLIALRSDESVTIYDPPTDRKWTFDMPAEVPRDADIFVYLLAADQLLVQHSDGYWSGGPAARLLWIKPDGTVTRRKRLELQGWVPPPPRRIAWGFCASVPVPLVWIPGVLVGGPLTMIQDNKADNFASGFHQTWEIAWPPFVVVIAVSAAATWIARKWQRQYRRPATGLWCAFVFLLGVPGLLAYWFEHRRATLEACGDCGQLVPRDRDACAACHTPFPAPPLVGTEIFA